MSNLNKTILPLFISLAVMLILSWLLKTEKPDQARELTQVITDTGSEKLSISAKYEGSEDFLIQHNSKNQIHPGSNYKLLTTAAVLDKLGPSYTFETEVLQSSAGLILRGTGDPSLKKKDLESLAKNLNAETIIYDDTWFKGEQYGPDWDEKWYENHFSVPIAALQIENNLLNIYATPIKNGWNYETYPFDNVEVVNEIDFKKNKDLLETGILTSSKTDDQIFLKGDSVEGQYFETSVTVKNPALLTTKTFREIVNPKAQIKHIDDVKIQQATQVALNISAETRDLLKEMLTYSRNNYAESFIRALGEEVQGFSKLPDSQAKGVEIMKNFLQDKVGIDGEEIALFDGSGLSPKTRISTDNMVKLLDYVGKQNWGEVFWQSLPRGGEGTLTFRFKNYPDRSSIIAKSGTHETSHSLSGKTLNKKGKEIIFSINFVGETQEALAVLDEIVLALSEQF